MIEQWSARLSHTLVQKKAVGQENEDIAAYGLSLILSSGIISATMLGVAIITETFLVFAVYAATYWIIRWRVGLHHCDTYWQCFTLSVSTYVALVIVMKAAPNWWVPFLFILLTCLSLAAKAINIRLSAEESHTKHENVRLKKMVAFTVFIAALCFLFFSIQIYLVAVPLSYGLFATSLLSIPEEHKQMEE